MKNVGVSG